MFPLVIFCTDRPLIAASEEARTASEWTQRMNAASLAIVGVVAQSILLDVFHSIELMFVAGAVAGLVVGATFARWWMIPVGILIGAASPIAVALMLIFLDAVFMAGGVGQ